ncbi:MAG TPA: hypothetical protein VFO55_03325, partial [Gemmatimonadaceae bacterium]|nr:hypothetical protein [Gemmatimonadaceae bacterium]
MNRHTLVAFCVLAAGCSRTEPPVSTPAPAPAPVVATPATSAQRIVVNEGLPPMPLVEGPLAIKVVYPAENAPMTSRDSNYMIGSVGNGTAKLTINGQPAVVYPNGAFMAFMRNPPPTEPRFELVATTARDTARHLHNLRVPTVVTPLPLEGRLIVDSTEFAARATSTLFLRDEERTTIRIRIPSNATATLVAGNQRIPLDRNGEIASKNVTAAELRSGGTLLIVRGGDTTRMP